MIDWLNPSNDVVEAKRIGYEEGVKYADEQMEEIQAELEAAKAENANLRDKLQQAVAIIEASK